MGGYDQLSPVFSNGNITYTYDDADTATVSSYSLATVNSSQSIVVSGSNFGSSLDVKVYLRSSTVVGRKKRAAPPSKPDNIIETDKKEDKLRHPFWDHVSNRKEIKWKCMSNQVCDHESLA